VLAIIGGSGLEQLPGMEITRQVAAATSYGEPSAPLLFGRLNGHDVVFLARHGKGHRLPPHKINYRANLWALHQHGIRHVVGVATVGGITPGFDAGTLVVPDQIIDYTWGRASSYFDGEAEAVKHVDFTQPYCASLRQRLAAAARQAGEPVRAGGTYAATQGPRLESAAEIARLARDGADMVGMTGMPEAALARELNLCYATLAVVVNAAAGTGSSAQAVDLAQAESLARASMARVIKILEAVAADGD
jgi:5'-methylthioadenosine phosphorylase